MFLFVLAWQPLVCRAARRLQTAANLPTLLMTDAGGASMIGIVCDNLRDMPDALRNHLFLALPDTLRNVPLAWSLTNADSKDDVKIFNKSGSKFTKQKLVENVGTIRQEQNRLIYTPPDEFNSNPEPQRLGEVRRSPRRVVLLTVRRREANGEAVIVAQQSIILARPPIVAVHGINSSTKIPDVVRQRSPCQPPARRGVSHGSCRAWRRSLQPSQSSGNTRPGV